MNLKTFFQKNKTVLAPLAGIGNLPFRLLVKSFGCDLLYSEMISANGLVFGSKRTQQMLHSVPEEKPLAVQIFGTDPEVMAAAAGIVEHAGADILDINFGCAVRKVVKTGAGVGLMKAPKTAEKLLSVVRKAVRIPVTIKIRSGWHPSGDQALEVARIAEGSGMDAIAVHPRTAGQGFSGRADRSIITRVKETVSIPVIGNGDIQTPMDAEAMLHETGCDAIMIGRAAIGTPWIFAQVADHLDGRNAQPVDLSMRFDAMRNFLHASVACFGEKVACRMMRSRLGWFAKGLPLSSKFRESIKQIESETDAREQIDRYREWVRNSVGST